MAKSNNVSSHVKTMPCPKSLKAAPLLTLQVILLATTLEEICFMRGKKGQTSRCTGSFPDLKQSQERVSFIPCSF